MKLNKAILVAAGMGTRLRPITEKIPKCLVSVSDKPLLGIWLANLKRDGLSEVLVNTHYLADQVVKYCKQNDFGLKVELVYEEELLGTAGTIRDNFDFVKDEECFLFAHADNLADISALNMINFLNDKKAAHSDETIAGLAALFNTNYPKTCGIVDLDKNDRIANFVEKPDEPKSNLANAAIYILTPEIEKYLTGDKGDFLDFSLSVFPKLVHNSETDPSFFGYKLDSFIEDVGTPERLEKLNAEPPSFLSNETYNNLPTWIIKDE